VRSPLAEANAVIGALNVASQELKGKQEQSEFLMRELAHRSKNLLAVVQGMALQTARQAADIDHFVLQLSQRLQGLGESVDLMVKQNWQGAWLADLVNAHLGLFGAGPRAHAEGPPLFLSPVAVQNIGFALNELATNASKHGSLAHQEGRVNVSWCVLDDGGIRIEWVERAGAVVQSPSRQGFGSLVLTQLVAQALQGSCKLDFQKEGLYWSLDFPAFHVLATTTTEEAP
jgi:two-component sensor histidine kinase